MRFLLQLFLLSLQCWDCTNDTLCDKIIDIDHELYTETHNIGIEYCVNKSILQLLSDVDAHVVHDPTNKLIEKMIESKTIIGELSDIELHHLLYHVNIKLDVFRSINTANSNYQSVLYKFIQETIFQKVFENKVFNIYQQKYVYHDKINEYLSDDIPDSNNTLLFNLFNEILVNHTISSHQFLQSLLNGDISHSIFDTLVESIYPFTRVWHLLISGIANSIPLRFRHVVFRNCLDETMVDVTQSHPILFQRTWRNKIPKYISPIDKVFYAFNAKVYSAYHSKSVTFSIGAFAFFEKIVTIISDAIFVAGQHHYNFTNTSDLYFWEQHTEIDITHSNELYKVLNEIINMIKHSKSLSKDEKTQKIHQIIYGGIFLMDAEVSYLDQLFDLQLKENSMYCD